MEENQEYLSEVLGDADTEDFAMEIVHDARLFAKRSGLSLSDSLMVMQLVKDIDMENELVSLNYKLRHVKDLMDGTY